MSSSSAPPPPPSPSPFGRLPAPIRWLPALVWGLLVWGALTLSFGGSSGGGWLGWLLEHGAKVHGDKLVHGLLFAVQAGLLVGAGPRRAIGAGGSAGTRWSVVGPVLATVAYGALTEWVQAGIPGRDASVGDFVADLVGALVGGLLVARRRRFG